MKYEYLYKYYAIKIYIHMNWDFISNHALQKTKLIVNAVTCKIFTCEFSMETLHIMAM